METYIPIARCIYTNVPMPIERVAKLNKKFRKQYGGYAD